MKKFLTYEIKRSFNYLTFMAIAGLFFSIIVNFIFKKIKGDDFSLIVGFYLLIGVIFLVDLIYFTYRFRNDLFSKSSYFTFTINLPTSKIVFAKLLAGLIITFLSLIIFVGAFSLISEIFEIAGQNMKSSFNGFVLFSILIYWILAYVFLTIGVSLSRVKLLNRYYEFVSIILSIVLLVLVMWVMRNLYRLKATMISIKDFSIRTLSNINGVDFFMVYYDINHKAIGINLWILLLAAFLIVFGFFVNVYLIEEKIDL